MCYQIIIFVGQTQIILNYSR